MGRAPCCEKVGLRRGRWTAEEDEILINYIKQNGEGSWRSLPKKAGLLRCGKSCRLRWINYLRTDLKRGNFSREEDETIIKLHRSVGNKWSLIASNLPGRTDNEVKNYWNSHLSRKIYSFRSSTNGSLVTAVDMAKMASKCKRKGGRVSRAVAKKYNMHTISNATITNNATSPPKNISGISAIQVATTAAAVAENAELGLIETTHGVPESAVAENAAHVRHDAVGLVEESGKGHLKLKPLDNNYDYDEVEGGCINSMYDIRLDDGESRAGTLMPSPEKLEGDDKEVVGPNDGLDDVSLFLQSLLESDLMDLDLSEEISMHTAETQNESRDPESASIHKDTDSGATNSSNSETGENDGLCDCFSPLNSYFNHHELVTWDAEYAAPEPEYRLWDQEDDLLWPWDNQTTDTQLLH